MTVTIFFRCSNRNRISASKVARMCLPFLPFIFAVLCQFLGPKFCFKQGWGDIGRCYFEQSAIERRISSPPQLDGWLQCHWQRRHHSQGVQWSPPRWSTSLLVPLRFLKCCGPRSDNKSWTNPFCTNYRYSNAVGSLIMRAVSCCDNMSAVDESSPTIWVCVPSIFHLRKSHLQ